MSDWLWAGGHPCSASTGPLTPGKPCSEPSAGKSLSVPVVRCDPADLVFILRKSLTFSSESPSGGHGLVFGAVHRQCKPPSTRRYPAGPLAGFTPGAALSSWLVVFTCEGLDPDYVSYRQPVGGESANAHLPSISKSLV